MPDTLKFVRWVAYGPIGQRDPRAALRIIELESSLMEAALSAPPRDMEAQRVGG